MATQNPTVFEPRHIDSLPRALIQSLIGGVLFLHGILIVMALQNIPLVELGGNGGGGSSALYVSVLQGVPATRTVHAQPSTSTEKTVAAKEKSRSGLIATSSATSRTAQTAQAVENKADKPSEANTLKQQITPDTRAPASPQAKSGSDNSASNGAGTSVGEGKSTGSGQGEGTGNSVGSGGSGNGPARSVSLSQLRYKRAVKPEYPARSIQRHETGQVNVRVVVDAAGRVHAAKVVSSSGFERLDEAALKAARRSTFHPYMEHGRPIFAMAIIPYRFNLNNR